MYCQKCRTPLKSDSTLDELNPAAFDLVVGSSLKTEHKTDTSPKISYPQERKALYDKVTKEPHTSLHKRTVPAPRQRNGDPSLTTTAVNPDMSFIEITESQIVSPEIPVQDQLRHRTKSSKENGHEDEISDEKPTLSWQTARQQKLFSILSAHSDIDHPICTECSGLLLSSLNAKLVNANRERDAYAAFLKQLQQASVAQRNEGAVAEEELKALRHEEQESYQELLRLEEEKRTLEAELADLEEEDQRLEREEEHFWRDRNTFNERQHELETELSSLQQKFSHDQKQLERLQRTNVYNDTFYISHDGFFGTINGLRLGRLPNHNVEWAEINAAWGQTLLLLQTVAERLNFTFQGYRLRPLGSTSRIEKLDYPQQSPDTLRDGAPRNQSQAAQPTPKVTPLDLYSSGDYSLSRLLIHKRFDQGMAAFLDCLSQLGKFVEKSSTNHNIGSVRQRDREGRPSSGLSRTPSTTSAITAGGPLRLPYAIEGDKISSRDHPEEAVSIRLGISQDESFTKACKYVLTCCKYLLAHVSNLEHSKVVS